MKILVQLIKKCLPFFGIRRNLLKAFGLKKTFGLYFGRHRLNDPNVYYGNLPTDSQRFLQSIGLKEGDYILDIGANVGDVTNYFLSKKCIVEAYEPNPDCIDFINHRIINQQDLTLIRAAVSNQNGEVEFYIVEDCPESGSLLNRDTKFNKSKITAPSVSIANVLSNKSNRIKLIKIDIEGGEYDLLDILVQPNFVEKFEYCAVEVHYDKIPELKPRHEEIVAKIKNLNLEKKFFLGWH